MNTTTTIDASTMVLPLPASVAAPAPPVAPPATASLSDRWDEMLCAAGMHDVRQQLVALRDEVNRIAANVENIDRRAWFWALDASLTTALDLTTEPPNQ